MSSTVAGMLRSALVVMVMVASTFVGVAPCAGQGTPGTTADVVYGQLGSFSTSTPNSGGVSADSLSSPDGLILDSSDNLYTTDPGNNRVLLYSPGSTTATRVYGQLGSFTTAIANNGGVSADSLRTPPGVALDGEGNLYVAQFDNNRVLFYPPGSTTATRVYGQLGSFTTAIANNGGISADSLFGPNDVAVDDNDNLYVADLGNNRVLFYLAGSTTATQVYGQGGSFTTRTANNGGISADSLSQPAGLGVDSKDNLYVADQQNNRVLFYPEGSTTATQVWGQTGSFTSNTANLGGVSAKSLSQPRRVAAVGNGDLYVIDLGNNRALKYVAHDLALVKITAPSTVAVDPGVAVTKSVKVQFQNRGSEPEVLPDAGVLGDGVTTGLVRLTVSVVDDDGEGCQPAIVSLDAAKNAGIFKNGPKTVKSKAKLKINYLVTYQCNSPARKTSVDLTPGDYDYTATVFRSVLGDPDSHPADDSCPHDALATTGHKDPHPDGKIVDKGCGTRKPDKTLGNPIATNVTLK
jgi:sugar lactone lactonase YvrE